MADLMTPFTSRGLILKNRMVMSPMCQYSCRDDGRATEWHLVHYGSRAVGGAALIIFEASAVEARGRISPEDLGIWEDGQIEGLSRIVRFCKEQGARVGIQLAHAGRKAVTPEAAVAPSAIAHSDRYETPTTMTEAEVEGVIRAFGAATRRAVQAGFDMVEVHGAHGYLVEEFMSPLTNHRQDKWALPPTGASPFLRAVLEEVRAALPREMPLWLRVSGTEYVPEGLDVEAVAAQVSDVRELVDLVDVSSGGAAPVKVDEWPGWHVGLAERIRQVTGLPTGIVGRLEEPALAQFLVKSDKADVLLFARGLLRDPYLPMTAALALGGRAQVPEQYTRAYASENLLPPASPVVTGHS